MQCLNPTDEHTNRSASADLPLALILVGCDVRVNVNNAIEGAEKAGTGG